VTVDDVSGTQARQNDETASARRVRMAPGECRDHVTLEHVRSWTSSHQKPASTAGQVAAWLS